MALSAQTIEDKNALSTDAVFLVLLDIYIPSADTVRVVNNTEDIVWDGKTYLQFPFELEDINQSSTGEVPQYTIKLSNATRIIERYLQQYDLYLKQNGIDGNEIRCDIFVVNSNDLINPVPIVEHNTILSQPTTTPEWATFKLTARNPYNKSFPPRRIIKNFCAWKFKGIECNYVGVGAICDKTLTQCRAYGNASRFGGFVGVDSRGLVIV